MATHPRILITRPRAQGETTAAALETAGFATCLAPVLEIHPVKTAREPVQHALEHAPQAVLTTSQHAIACLAEMSPQRGLPLAVVGETSAEIARTLGYTQTIAGTGDVDSLVETLTKQCPPERRPLLYLRGKDISTDIAGSLRAQGFGVEEIIVYEARAVTALESAVIEALREGQITTALFYSRRSLTTFEQLLCACGLEKSVTNMAAITLSEAIATAASLHWQGITASPTPDTAGMIVTLKKLSARS